MTILPYALCSLADVRLHPAIPASVSDDFLIMLINQATKIIEHYCNGRRFLLSSHVENWLGDSSGSRILKHYPVVTLTSVEYATSDPKSNEWSALDTSFYNSDLDRGIINSFSQFSTGFNNSIANWRATYTAGYATIPEDLQAACVQLVNYMYSIAIAQGIQAEKLGDRDIRYFQPKTSSLIEEAGLADALDPYRTPVI